MKKNCFRLGNEPEDWDTRQAVMDLLKVIKNFPQHFDETTMFINSDEAHLKREFKVHFRNISRIMDCVGCDKCKLWGKLQVMNEWLIAINMLFCRWEFI